MLLILTGSACGKSDIDGKDSAKFSGYFDSSIRNDTLLLTYHLTLKNLVPDSIILVVGDYRHYNGMTSIPIITDSTSGVCGNCAIFRRADTLPYANDWRKVRLSGNRLYCNGHVKAVLSGRSTMFLTASAKAYAGPDTSARAFCAQGISSIDFGLYGGFWAPNCGYFWSRPGDGMHRKGLLFGYDLGFEIGQKDWSVVVLSSWSVTKHFSFSEPLIARYRRFFGNRHVFAIGPFGGPKLAMIAHDQEVEYKKVQWGVEGGLSVETPFERLSYSYATQVGGYHSLELFLSPRSTSSGLKVGTLFTVRGRGDIWMAQMGFHIEGYAGSAGYPSLARDNTRPLPVRLLGWSGLLPGIAIYGSTYGVYYGVCKIIGKKPEPFW